MITQLNLMNLINLQIQYSFVAKLTITICLHWLALKRLQDKWEHKNTRE